MRLIVNPPPRGALWWEEFTPGSGGTSFHLSAKKLKKTSIWLHLTSHPIIARWFLTVPHCSPRIWDVPTCPHAFYLILLFFNGRQEALIPESVPAASWPITLQASALKLPPHPHPASCKQGARLPTIHTVAGCIFRAMTWGKKVGENTFPAASGSNGPERLWITKRHILMWFFFLPS